MLIGGLDCFGGSRLCVIWSFGFKSKPLLIVFPQWIYGRFDVFLLAHGVFISFARPKAPKA